MQELLNERLKSDDDLTGFDAMFMPCGAHTFVQLSGREDIIHLDPDGHLKMYPMDQVSKEIDSEGTLEIEGMYPDPQLRILHIGFEDESTNDTLITVAWNVETERFEVGTIERVEFYGLLFVLERRVRYAPSVELAGNGAWDTAREGSAINVHEIREGRADEQAADVVLLPGISSRHSESSPDGRLIFVLHEVQGNDVIDVWDRQKKAWTGRLQTPKTHVGFVQFEFADDGTQLWVDGWVDDDSHSLLRYDLGSLIDPEDQ